MKVNGWYVKCDATEDDSFSLTVFISISSLSKTNIFFKGQLKEKLTHDSILI